eukprot:SAG31_NODE_4356_length_3316_cov_1.302145_1_plen_325_part_00
MADCSADAGGLLSGRLAAATALAAALQKQPTAAGPAARLVREGAAGLALVAGRKITRGEEILTVPWACCFSSAAFDGLVRAGDDFSAIAIPGDAGRSPGLVKILFLLLAHTAATDIFGDEGAVAQLYLHSLPEPEDCESMPLYWSDDAIEQLGPLLAPTLRGLVTRLRAEIDATHAVMLDALDSVAHALWPGLLQATAHKGEVAATGGPSLLSDAMRDKCTLAWCQWAFCCMNSRSFTTCAGDPADGEDEHGLSAPRWDGPILIPLVDMTNHTNSTDAITIEKRNNSAGMTIVATRELNVGEPLQWAYRDCGGDLYFLLNYVRP